MKTTLLILAIAFGTITARAATPEVATFTLINPTGPRWAVETGGEKAWLSNPPARQYAKLVADMRQYYELKTRIANLQATIDSLDHEYDQLDASWWASDSAGRRYVAELQSRVTVRANTARRQLRDASKAFAEFRKKHEGDSMEAPTIRVTVIPAGRRIQGLTEWRYIGPAPVETEAKAE
jgi:hypothetical protein